MSNKDEDDSRGDDVGVQEAKISVNVAAKGLLEIRHEAGRVDEFQGELLAHGE